MPDVKSSSGIVLGDVAILVRPPHASPPSADVKDVKGRPLSAVR